MIEDLQLDFVNNKSKERVLKIENELIDSLKSINVHVDDSASKTIETIGNKTELYALNPVLKDLKSNTKDTEFPKFSIASLRPFLFPSYPATIQQDYNLQSNSEYTESRKNFMLESREEHHRLLYAFQDRLTRELCATDDHYQNSPFQDAMTRISIEQNIPPGAGDKRKEGIQSRFNSLMRRSQKQTIVALESQKRKAKLLHEQEMFNITHPNPESKDAEKNPQPLNITFPFSFLSDGGYAK